MSIMTPSHNMYILLMHQISKTLRHNVKIIDNPQEIANALNLYFINIGPSIAEQINSNRSHRDYFTKSYDSTLSLTNINEDYVASLIDRLKNKESSGIDRLSNKHLKAAKNLLAKPLTLLINQMLNTGIFPSKLKQSKVTPIFKAKGIRSCYQTIGPYQYFRLYQKF